ncbi:hypothetical protein [Streptomyces sp. NPDC002564]|uniref:hypothetical protein n=1 Tax=Streptomyces sp. NPDC002564 TaxID=3364649 RepID=UPI00369F6472
MRRRAHLAAVTVLAGGGLVLAVGLATAGIELQSNGAGAAPTEIEAAGVYHQGDSSWSALPAVTDGNLDLSGVDPDYPLARPH